MDTAATIQTALHELAEELPVERRTALHQQIRELVNELIRTDFSRLVYILYRVDVSEKTLKQMLQDHPSTDAGDLIASLLIERQLQKNRARKEHRATGDIPDEEKW
ncbi:MAG TPA: hypothetical protein VFZ78_04875 [Flavisolibacter sp.]